MSLRRNSVWQFSLTLAGAGTELVILLILAARLATAEFGALTVALSTTKIVFLLLDARIHEFVTPKLSRYLGRSRRGAWTWVNWSRTVEFGLNTVALLLCVAIALLGPFATAHLNAPLQLAAAFYTAGNALLKSSSLAILRCLGNVKAAALLAVTGGIAKLALLGGGLWFGGRSDAIIATMAAAAALANAAQALYAQRVLRERLGPVVARVGRAMRPANMRRQRHLLFSNYGTGLVEIAHRELDLQLVAWLAGPGEAGRYRLAKTLSMITLEALSPVVLVLLPEFSRRIAVAERADLRAFVRKVTRMLAGIGAAAGLAVLGVIAVYLGFIATAQQSAWGPALLLTLTFSALAPWMWIQAYLVAAGHPQVYLKASTIGAALALAVTAFAASRWGALGAALGHGVGLLLSTGLAAWGAAANLPPGVALFRRDPAGP